MGYVLSGDQLREFTRKLGEIQRQLGQDEYPHNPDKLKAALQAITEGRFEAVGGLFPSEIHAADLIPRKWKVVEDVASAEFRVEDLEFISFLEADEDSVPGTVMRKRAVRLEPSFGLSDAPKLLAEQDKIPASMRGKYIVLAGTLLRDPDGHLYVPYLYWRDGQWLLVFRWLDDAWRGLARLPCRKPARNA
ncbi:MAG: hypothetical protein ABH835_01930 [Patescibacteria group bacterium]